MKKLIIIIICAFTYQLANAQDPTAKAILDKVSAKYKGLKSFSANFKQSIHSPLADVDESFEGSAIISGNKYAIKTEMSEVYTDGKTMWAYMPEVEEVNVSEYDPEEGEITPSNIYTIYESGYKYLFNGEEKIDGKTYKVVELSPTERGQAIFKIRIWVDPANNTIRRWKLFQKDGNRYTYDITNFKANIPVTEATFKFDKTKHKGVEVIDLR